MTKAKALEILMLLSALESWSFSAKSPLPDYLFERMEQAINTLREQVLEGA